MQRKGTPNSGSILSPFRTNLLLIFAFVEGAQIVLSFFLSISFSIYLSLLLHTYIYYITFFFLFILIFTQLSYCARCSFLPFSYSLYLHSFCLSIYISFLKVGHSLPLLIIFIFSIQLIINKFSIKFCEWLESNRGPLDLKATALPTEPQPLPLNICFCGTLLFVSSLVLSLSLSLSLSWRSSLKFAFLWTQKGVSLNNWK